MVRIEHTSILVFAGLMMLFAICSWYFYMHQPVPHYKDSIYYDRVALNLYGSVIHQHHDKLSDAIIEKVVIYSKEHANSEKTIERPGLLFRYKGAEATVLICHGFMCDKFDVGVLRRLFPKGRFNVMTFDFRAHGENTEGQYCTFGRDEAYDVLAAGNFLKNHSELQGKPLFVYGFSMGAVASIEAQAKQKLFDAMILDCPFDSTENVIKQGLSNMKMSFFGYEFDMPGRSLLEKYVFHPYVQSFIKMMLKTVAHLDSYKIQTNVCPCTPAESIKQVTVPCFFIHCKNDEKVPMKIGLTVFEGAAGPKIFWKTNGRRHFDSFFSNPELYTQNVRTFFSDVLQGKFNQPRAPLIIEDEDEKIVMIAHKG